MIDIKKNPERACISYTDASVSRDFETTGAGIIVNIRSNRIEKAFLGNFGTVHPTVGHRKSSQTAELTAITQAMFLASAGSLIIAVSDCKRAIEDLNEYRETSGKSRIFGMSDKLQTAFARGLERQPNVQFQHKKRIEPQLKLIDSFSRIARGWKTGVKTIQPQPFIPFQDQVQHIRQSIHSEIA